jgi:hypothetical protein
MATAVAWASVGECPPSPPTIHLCPDVTLCRPVGQGEGDFVEASDTLRVVSRRRLLDAVLVLLVALGVFGMAACDDGRRDATPLERGKVREIVVQNGHVPGGKLDAQVRKGDPLDLRVFVIGAGGPGGVVHLRGYGLAARVKRQAPASGFWARLRFRATRVGRFAVVMERPHVRVGYVIVNP